MWRNKVKRTYDNLKESIRCYVYGWIRKQEKGRRMFLTTLTATTLHRQSLNTGIRDKQDFTVT